MNWQPDDIPKEVQEHFEREAERRGLFSSPRFTCSVCGHRFRVNIDGCPKCGAQAIIKAKE